MELQFYNITGALNALVEQRTDLAMSYWIPNNHQLESVPLFNMDIVAVANLRFCSAFNLKGKISTDKLHQTTQVVLRDNDTDMDKGEYGLLDNHKKIGVDDTFARYEMIRLGVGWGRLPAHMVETALARGELIALNIEDYPSREKIEVRLARRKDQLLSMGKQVLWDSLCSQDS